MSAPDDLCLIHVYVSGRVQGVWFRAFTQKTALAEGLTGWAKNLSDGRVEAMLCGERKAVEKVLAALHRGPELAIVNSVETEELPWQKFNGFGIQ